MQNDDMLAQLSDTVKSLVESQKAAQLKIAQLERARETDQQTIVELKDEVALLAAGHQSAERGNAILTRQMKHNLYRKYVTFFPNGRQRVPDSFMAMLPPPNQDQRLSLYVKDIPLRTFEPTWQDGNNFCCSPIFFFENLVNLGQLFFNGQGLRKYPGGVQVPQLLGNFQDYRAEVFFDAFIKSLITTRIPEALAQHFIMYFDDWIKLPTWWRMNEQYVVRGSDGNFKLERILTNAHNEYFKFKVLIRANNHESRMNHFHVEKL